MCKWNNGGIAVDLPDGIAMERERRTVCIDECIVPQMQALWAEGVQTRGCCCGHNKKDPEVILSSEIDPTQLHKAHTVLCFDAERRWEIYEWNIVQVATTPAISKIFMQTD